MIMLKNAVETLLTLIFSCILLYRFSESRLSKIPFFSSHIQNPKSFQSWVWKFRWRAIYLWFFYNEFNNIFHYCAFVLLLYTL